MECERCGSQGMEHLNERKRKNFLRISSIYDPIGVETAFVKVTYQATLNGL